MKKLFAVAIGALLVACSSDVVMLDGHGDRVSDLERRMTLMEQISESHSLMILANSVAIEAETEARLNGDLQLAELLAAEEQARLDGDTALSNQLNHAVYTQFLVNKMVSFRLAMLTARMSTFQAKLADLQSRVHNIENRIDDLGAELVDLILQFAQMETEIDVLSAQQVATQAQLDEEGVRVFKCAANNSSERILRINGYFYGAMNRVTMQNIEVVTGSTSESYTTPNMCETSSGSLVLPNPGGQCTPVSGPNASVLIPGQTIVVPAYTTANVSVVSSVRIALDILVDGNYITTDGGPACHFSIFDGGTAQSGLIEVQGGLQ